MNMIPFKNPLKIFTFSNLVFVNDENGEEFYAKTQLIHGWDTQSEINNMNEA